MVSSVWLLVAAGVVGTIGLGIAIATVVMLSRSGDVPPQGKKPL